MSAPIPVDVARAQATWQGREASSAEGYASAMRVSLPERLHQGADLLRTGTAATADDLEPFLPPATSVSDKLIGRWYGRPVPLVAQVSPPIRVRAER